MDNIAEDVLSAVFAFLPLEKRRDLGLICSNFTRVARQSYFTEKDKIELNKTRRAEFFERHLDKVRWSQISINRHLPPEFFLRHEDKLDWGYMSCNPSIPMEFLETHFKDLNKDYLGANSSVPIEFFEAHMIDYVFNWLALVDVHKVDSRTVEKYFNCVAPDYDEGFNEEFLDMFLDRVERSNNRHQIVLFENDGETKAIWPDITNHQIFSAEWFEANMCWIFSGYNWQILCSYGKMPLDFLERFIDTIDWSDLVTNEYVPPEFFERHLDELNKGTLAPIMALVFNHNIPAEFFEKHARQVDLRSVLIYSKLSKDFLERNLEHLDWRAVSGNASVPIEFLEEHIEKLYWHNLCLGRKNLYYNPGLKDKTGAGPLDALWEEEEFLPWPDRS